ncbi:ABC transporter permease [Piscinibacter terrae]|uniref:ABC transporter permease n=1 Tax=Piscinibacter terrae TaxID=2496871 RepID=A0A3N7HPI6_9BURK|nr:FtsX-like permease family protein [Albitalea terrae]RQP22651.1 ABC transporter permease [Albitalea terrae]
MYFLQIAWSNVLRNRRRSLSMFVVAALGVSMIVFTNGFTDGISANMSSSIINQIDGHIRIQHKDYKKYYITDQEKVLLADWQGVSQAVTKIAHVQRAMPRVMMGGLISHDDKTTTFFGAASDLAQLPAVLPDYAINLVTGKPLSADDPGGVLLGTSLAKSLSVKVGDELVLLSKTVRGEQSNTLVHVRGIVNYPTDDKVEQSLLLSALDKPIADDLLELNAGATQLVLRLDDEAHVPEVMAALDALFAARGLPWKAIAWNENPVYARVVGMFTGIGVLITFVLVVMVGVITSNALLMAFFERIREIGTMRAVGMDTWQVHALLYIESSIVGVLGASGGLVLGTGLTALAGGTGIPLDLIGQSVYPQLGLASVLVSTLCPIACIVVAATMPIRSATRMSVTDALNYQ